MYQNYIFDLYGTLVDIRTNENSHYLWRKMSECYSALGAAYKARELKLDYRRLVDEQIAVAAEKLERIIGGSADVSGCAEPDLTSVFAELYTQKGVVCDRAQVRQTAIMFRTLSRSRLALYDGVTGLLDKLKSRGKRIYLLSNAQTDFTRPELEMLGLVPYFDGIYISSEQGIKKPSPLLFQRLFQEYSLEISESIMIGNDAYSDIAGAREVGMDCLYIHTAISPELTGEVDADYLVMDGDFRKVENLILR